MSEGSAGYSTVLEVPVSRLAGRVCVVNGAASEIGQAVANRFASEGGVVAGVDKAAHAVGDHIVQADLGDEPQVEAMYEQVVRKYGRIDVIYNNMGLMDRGDHSVLDTSLETWRRVLDANLTSIFLSCKHGIPHLRNTDPAGGSVINADQPVQVVAFNAIAQLPDYSVANADHMEETVMPAEVLGNEYVVVPPTTPLGKSVGHVVRIYGNVDGTHLTYSGTKPTGAPDTINAGDMVQIPPLPTGQPAPDCLTVPDHCMVSDPFVVTGDQPFAVASYMVGGTLQMPGTDSTTSQGDPSMTMEVTPKQFRQQYTFLAPADYQENFADVIVPMGASITLDGKPLTLAATPIAGSTWGFIRAPLDNSGSGAHSISTTNPAGLGLQVEGFGFATSYYYPGGLNLIHISEPPEIPVVK